MDPYHDSDFPVEIFDGKGKSPKKITSAELNGILQFYEDMFSRKIVTSCPTNIVKDVNRKISQLNVCNFSELFPDTTDFPNQRVEQIIDCILVGLAMNKSDPNINSFVQELDTIAAGAYGVVYIAKNSDVPLFIVKKLKKDTPHLYLEARVGILLNKLRAYTPGFALTHQLYQDRDLEEIRNDVYKWGKPHTQKNYLFIENIPNAKSVKDTLTNNPATFMELITCLLQIESTLNVAYKTMSFTHNDLHYSNVLIQSTTADTWIPIYYGENTFYMLTDQITRILDFGKASIHDPETDIDIPGGRPKFLGEKYCPFPLTDFSVILTTVHYLIKHRKTSMLLEEKNKFIRFANEIYYRLLGRNIDDDSEFLWKDARTREIQLEKKQLLQKRISSYRKDLAIVTNIPSMYLNPKNAKDLEGSLGYLSNIDHPKIQESLERLIHLDPSSIAKIITTTIKSFENYLRKDIEELTIRERSIPEMVDVFYNGELKYNPQWGAITHDDIIRTIFDIVGEDSFQGILCNDLNFVLQDPRPKSICFDMCHGWRHYRKNLFS